MTGSGSTRTRLASRVRPRPRRRRARCRGASSYSWPRRARAIDSWEEWTFSNPTPRLTAGRPLALNTLASAPPPVPMRVGSSPIAVSAAVARLTGRSVDARSKPTKSSSIVIVASTPLSAAATLTTSIIRSSCAASLSRSRLRASHSRRHRSGTTFVAVPPLTTPTFAVVSSSMRPTGMAAVARAAATIAERPFSGSMPACAARPWNSAVNLLRLGALTMTVPTGPSLSKMKAVSACNKARSSSLAPRRPTSSEAVMTISTGIAGGSAVRSRASASSAVTAALSSAPRIVSPALRATPFSMTTRISPATGTVSMCAHRAIGVPAPRPGTRTTRLPAPAAGARRRVVLVGLKASGADLGDDEVGDGGAPGPTATASRRGGRTAR